MQIKKFYADSIHNALKMVKEEFGSEAVILSTKTLSNGIKSIPFWHKGHRHNVEITAAIDVVSEGRSRARIKDKDDYRRQVVEKKEFCNDKLEIVMPVGERDDIEQVKEMLSAIMKNFNIEIPFGHSKMLSLLYRLFIDLGIDANITFDICDKLESYYANGSNSSKRQGNDMYSLPPSPARPARQISLKSPELFIEALRQILMSMIEVNGAIYPEDGNSRVLSFIGTTGVGKTTTIAKIAADFIVKKNKGVYVISFLDNKIAGNEQILRYGKIIGFNVGIVKDKEEFECRIKETYNSVDLILIDTPGMSYLDRADARFISNMLDISIPVNHILVSPVNDGKLHLVNTYIKNLSEAMKLSSIIFTKMDEALTIAPIIEYSIAHPIKVSYLTDGQKVPGHFMVASKEKITNSLIDEIKDKFLKIDKIDKAGIDKVSYSHVS